jgi:hypothetical protein
MLESSPNTSRGWIALLAVAFIACGGRTADLGDGGTSSGGGSGAFPYSGPSCNSTTISGACWSCIEGSCPALVSCVTGSCSGYFDCFCACSPNDNTCLQDCQQSESPACASCLQSADTCVTQSCEQACVTTSTGSGGGSTGGSSTGGGTGSGSSGGTTVSSECTTSSMTCRGGMLQACMTLENGTCTSAYFQISAQTFPCASCTDLTSCQQQATAACQ